MRSRRQAIFELSGLATFLAVRHSLGAGPLPPAQKRLLSIPLVDNSGNVISRYDGSASYFADDLGAGIVLEMALIPGGAFKMGSISNVPVPPILMWEQPVHKVSVKPFALGTYAVTRSQWRRVSKLPQLSSPLHQPPSEGADDLLPVDVVSWDEAIEFCQRLQLYAGREYRLPTEAEWEYAGRAGTTTKYHFGDGISLQVSNYNDGVVRPLGVTPVGSKQAPNRFGLHDMHGNVLEWCQDWVHQTYDGAPSDGSAWDYGADSFSRIGRGGSYLFGADAARSGARYPNDIRATFSGAGLRLALDISNGILDPVIRGGAITNAASWLRDGLSPGEIVTLQGDHIGPKTPVSLALDERGLVSTERAGFRVLFDGSPAPLLYVSSNQINAVVPYSVAGQTSTQIMVENQGQTSAPVAIPVVDSIPALFTADSSGEGQGAIANEDGSRNSPTNPARRGSVISVFATGEGRTSPGGVDGKLASSPPPVPVLPVELFIGSSLAQILYSGGAPGEVAGVLQVNARVPDSVGSGPQSIILRVGNVDSQSGVFVTVV